MIPRLLLAGLLAASLPVQAQLIEFQGVPTAQEILQVLRPDMAPPLSRSAAPGTPRTILSPSGQDLTRPGSPAPQATGEGARPRPSQPAISFSANFAFGSAVVPPGLVPILTAYGDALRLAPALRIEISGHTDIVGDPQANDALSLRRAEAAREDIVARFGIDRERILVRGAGQRELLPTAAPTAAAQRRIQVTAR